MIRGDSGSFEAVHIVAHEVPIPIDGLEKKLEECARPGFTGSQTIFLRVHDAAALQVWFATEKLEHIRVGRPVNASPEFRSVFGNGEPTERQIKVREALARQKYRFRLVLSVTKVIADFVDGEIRDIKFVSVSE